MIVTSSPEMPLRKAKEKHLPCSEEASANLCLQRRRVWQGEAPSEPQATLKPSVTDRIIPALADKLLRQRLDNAVWHKRLNVAT